MDPLGLHTLGEEELEREMFKLQPGQVSGLVGTPQGQVVMKCDRRIPPDPSKKLEQERDAISRTVMERKVQIETQVLFRELRDRANARLMLKDASKPEDLIAET